MEEFWEVVEEFNDEQKGQFLMFITGCSRPPLLVRNKDSILGIFLSKS
jgi:hypothetical protein